MRKILFKISVFILVCFLANSVYAGWSWIDEEKRQQEIEETSEKFQWWPTDAQPAPIKDNQRSGYWWWPTEPGEARPWGNRGFVYVYKIIFDYKEEELPPPQPQELRPSLLIKKVIKNVKIYFDLDKADLRDDHASILEGIIKSLKRNPEADLLVTGNCDIRGPEQYNLKLGRQRAESVKQFMLDEGVDKERIRIISRGKLDALAPMDDLVGMQKDRNAHFVIAEVEEIMLPYTGPPQDVEAKAVDEGKYVVEEEKDVESEVKVSTREYTVKKGDSLWKIAEKEYGGGHRWKYLYELNKDTIKDPDNLKPGEKILIPIE
ncbi:MAG: OmpA family protein [Candidatus Omnitrophica bacterium]|nr:OmpA family protein [Candidatus Omnitrophota bacterium]